MLPGEGGLDLARWLRGISDVPIAMLTAMGEETDPIIGLELGADDDVPKPFNPRGLLARIRAVLRRTEARGPRASAAQRPFGFAGWTLEPARVFEPFHRPEGSRNREAGGTGLGLPITCSSLRAHGGGVSLANLDGGGVRATVTLPG